MKNKKLLIIGGVVVAVILIVVGVFTNYIDRGKLTKYEEQTSGTINNTISNKVSTMQNINSEEEREMYIKVNNRILIATLENNSSADALIEKLEQGDITIDMKDYSNFEKVGELGFSLPRNDKQITTEAGDIILYQGNSITIYYDTNSWNFTKLGKINNITQKELKEILGSGDVTVTLSINNR